MKCNSCGFNCLPGTEVCPRCGAMLVWKGPRSEKEFMPPRAGARGKGRGRRIREAAGRRMGDVAEMFLPPVRAIPRERVSPALLSIIPGLGQMYWKDYARGGICFFLWLGALAGTAFFYSLWTAFFLVGIAVSVHCYALLSAMRPATFIRTRRELFRLTAPLVLVVGFCYGTVAYALERSFVLSTIGYSRSGDGYEVLGISRGDVLLIRRTRSAAPGRIVLMADTARTEWSREPRLFLAVFLAAPGGWAEITEDAVVLSEGRLSEAYSGLLPDDPGRKKMLLRAGENEVLVLPLESLPASDFAAVERLERRMRYGAESVRGCVISLYYPLGKRAWMPKSPIFE